MAGSKAKFIYNSDTLSGVVQFQKLIELDESNTRALGYVPVDAVSLGLLPDKRVQKLDNNERYITLIGQTAAGEGVARSLIVLDSDNGLFQAGGTVALPVLTGGANATIENVIFTVTSSRGESKSFTRIADTGLKDDTD